MIKLNKDERITEEVKTAKSIGFSLLWIGVFVVLLYRWMILEQSFMDNLDLFMVWFGASLVQFIVLAVKGIPISYPVSMKDRAQRHYLYLVPLLTGVLSAFLVFLRVGPDYRRMFGGFAITFLITFLLFTGYKLLVYFWEKRNL